MRRPQRLTKLIVTVAVTVAIALLATSVAAVPAGRLDLRDDPIRSVETRTDGDAGRTMSIEIGSGVLQVWALRADEPGTAVIHPCAEPAPTDRVTFRLDPSLLVQFARIFTAENSCLTSTTPIHVVVDDGGSVSATPSAAGDQYVSLPAPVELGTTRIDGEEVLTIPQPASVTANATAVVVAVEVLQNDEPGFITTYGCDGQQPIFADLSFSRGRVANVAAVPIGPGEDVCVYSSAGVTLRTTLLGEVRADGPTPEALPPSWSFVQGQVPAPSLRPINPVRVLDTRTGAGRPAAGRAAADETIELSFGDLVGPLTTAVSMNVTVVGARSGGFLTVWPCTNPQPTASNLNFSDNNPVPNLVVAQLSAAGTVCISSSSEAHVIADVNGTYEDDGGLTAVALEPERILDTRSGLGTVAAAGRIAGDSELVLQVTGGDVPAAAGAATLNITAAGATADGFVTVYPCDEARPTASNLNFRQGEASPNLVTTALSSDGTVCLYASESVHLIADLATWYGIEQPAGLVDLPPTRVLDTRQPIGVPTIGKVAPSQVVTLDFAETPKVADDADAVVMNVTAAAVDGSGFITVWPCDQEQPTVSNLNIRAGRTVANLTTVKLSEQGTVCLTTTARTHMIADVAGYLTDVPVEGSALTLDS